MNYKTYSLARLSVWLTTLCLCPALPANAQVRETQPPTPLQRPDHVNNADLRFFPPVFNQDGGSCGSASRIGYMFTYEINAYRGTDASLPENIYPTHFTWLLTNSHSGKEGMARANGVPNSVVYGGNTYSRLFGNQDCADPDFGWMQGYDKWYSAMFNRIERNSFSPYGLDTEKGREYLKNWLWNHQGDNQYLAGGICGIGVASACKQAEIGDDPDGTNRAAGVVGQKYVTRWGDGVDHALTIVGYDDRIVFDLDSNKVYGERDKDERGAWIVVNSWGNRWANQGFIYCPYKYSFPVRQHEGGAWKPEFYHVRKNYRPLRTLKLNMDYDHRSELKLMVGISSDPSATKPEATIELEHFKFAGDGRTRRDPITPDAATPMLGKWADGKLHHEPMEFGYDLTDLTAGFDMSRPLKYFFIIEQSSRAVGQGTIYQASIMDYRHDLKGVETPFCNEQGNSISPDGVHTYLQPGGKQTTVLTTVVWGEPLFAPKNLRVSPDAKNLIWDAPQPSHLPLLGYVINRNGLPSDTLMTNQECSYAIGTHDGQTDLTSYSVAALYDLTQTAGLNPKESAAIKTDTAKKWLPQHWTHTELKATSVASSPVFPFLPTPQKTQALQLKDGKLTIPDLFNTAYENVTIEYWLRPDSWKDWNQSVGPGWGNFLIHANNNGSLSAGWDSDSRLNSDSALVSPGKWHHFAFVIAGHTLTGYINGKSIGSVTSTNRHGMPAFGSLPLGRGERGGIDGQLAEIRIWSEARTPSEIATDMYDSYTPAGLPSTLIAYFPGQIVTGNGKSEPEKEETDSLWRDLTGRHHASLSHHCTPAPLPDFMHRTNSRNVALQIVSADSSYQAGYEYNFSYTGPSDLNRVRWTLKPLENRKGKHKNMAEPEEWEVLHPTISFLHAGSYLLQLTGQTENGQVLNDTDTIKVEQTGISADITSSSIIGRAGERLSFRPSSPIPGACYEWTLKGADRPSVYALNAGATYEQPGHYRVQLKVTDPLSGRRATERLTLLIKPVAPVADFECSPMSLLKGETVTLTDKSRYAPTQWNWQLDSRRLSLRTEGRHPQIRMDEPGTYDITLTATNAQGSNVATRRHALVVCNADSKNGLNFNREEAAVSMPQRLWADSTEQMTVEWWMNPSAQRATSGIGYSAATWQITGRDNGSLVFTADSASCDAGAGFLQPNQWHHYAVSFDQGSVRFYRDGEIFSSASLSRTLKNTGKDKKQTVKRPITSIPAADTLRLGGKQTPMNAVIDELRIWQKALSETTLQHYINAPIQHIDSAEKADRLLLYYDFNQNGGDVQDRTYGKHHGKRTAFGPDGDAWGRSTGVFSLNFNLPLRDLTEQMLPQAKMPFAAGQTVNTKDAKRFRAFNAADSLHPDRKWIIENYVNQGDSITTGLYVDRNKQDALCVYTGWDGFANRLENHKCYCVLQLQPGKYEFEVTPYQGTGLQGGSLIVAEGKGLPNADQTDQAIASCSLSEGRLTFVLDEAKEVSVGMLFNLSGRAGVAIRSIALRQAQIKAIP